MNQVLDKPALAAGGALLFAAWAAVLGSALARRSARRAEREGGRRDAEDTESP